MPEISVVVPIYNEEANVQALHRQIKEVCEKEQFTYEIILVDDGSTDGTPAAIQALSPVTCIQFRRNFGQTAAMDAGIRQAKYEYIITMDGDLQNNPQDIPRLIAHLEKNDLDVVSGWRKNRKDTWLKRFTSRGANLLRGILIKDHIHDSGCSLKIYKKECFAGMHLYGEMHRFIPALLEIKGFRVGEIEVDHRPRVAGKTKYNWKRTIKGFLDMISVWFWNKYAVRPLHLLGSLGLGLLFFGFLFAIWTVVLFFAGEDLSNNFQPVLTVSFIGGGIFMLVVGLLSDMISKTYYSSSNDVSYSIRKVVER